MSSTATAPARTHRPPRTVRASARGRFFFQYCFCFALLPNLPFWILGAKEGIGVAGWFSLDALVLGILSLYFKPVWVVGAFALDFLIDVADAIRVSYSTTFTDVVLSFRYLRTAIARSELMGICLLIFAVIAAIGVAWLRSRPKIAGAERRGATLLLLLLLATWTIMARARVAPDLLASSWRSPASDLARAWAREQMWAMLRGRAASLVLPSDSAASAAALSLADAGARPDFLVVLVESWGEANEPELRNALLQPFRAQEIAHRYRVREGTIPFFGPTGAGILRELCGVRTAVFGTPMAAVAADFAQCLPKRLQRQGFSTLAVDSAASFWPGGRNWYSQFGVQRVLGFNDLRMLGLSTVVAGPFRGVDDAQVAAQLPQILAAARQPAFLYFLTVNAHLPVHFPLPSDSTANCSIAAVTRQSQQACGWFKIESRTLASVAQAASAPNMPKSVVVVVGDHEPPFVDSARRAFSQNAVPYVLLVPR